jgi:hypothetical protein
LVHQLTITIDDELKREMSKHPEVDWNEVVKKAIREYLRRREIFEIYNAPIEKALSQKK